MQSQAGDRPFHVVSLNKFAILFFVTLGMYSLIWFYHQFEAQSRHRQTNPWWVVPQTLFNIIFFPGLCQRLAQQQQQQGVTYLWRPMLLVWVYVLAQLIAAGLSMYLRQENAANGWALLSLPILVAQFFSLYQFQLVANRVCGDVFGQSNARFSVMDNVLIVLGFVFWAGWINGLLMGPPSP